MSRRILQLIPSLDRAGAEKQLTLLAAALSRDEFDVHVCALTRGGPLQADLRRAGIPVTVIGKRWRADPLAFARLRRCVARLRPELIHTWLFAANAYGLAAARSCGLDRVIVGHRCADPWKGTLERAIDRYLARHATAVVANSPGVRDFYAAQGLPADKFRVIPNGVPPAPPSPVTRGQLLAELGLSQRSRLVGLVGRLWAQKRIKDAIWSADLLGMIDEDFHLLVIGDGPQRDRVRKYRDQVIGYGSVSLLGQRNDMERIMPHLDVLWSTSGYEGQSNSIMEAMAAGVPVVATDIPGTSDLVVPGQTGYLLPVGDRAGFARLTRKLLGDSALAHRLGQAGRKRMAEKFAVETMVQRYAELYREVLG